MVQRDEELMAWDGLAYEQVCWNVVVAVKLAKVTKLLSKEWQSTTKRRTVHGGLLKQCMLEPN